MKRRLLASLSVLFILSSINAQVFAADSSLQEITFNEYYSAIQAGQMCLHICPAVNKVG